MDALSKSIDLLEQWLEEVDTDPDLIECIMEYARGRGQVAMWIHAEGGTVDTPRWQTSKTLLDGGDSWKGW